MKMLILDTSQKEGRLALYQEGLSTIEKKFDAMSQQKILLPLIDSLLKEASLSLSDLTALAVAIGPGSFTGTRIGVMTMKTFAYTHSLPLIPFSSLLPFHLPGTLTLLDAKNGLCFVFDGETVEKLPHETVLKDPRKRFSPFRESLPFPTEQAIYSLIPILSLSPKESFTLVY